MDPQDRVIPFRIRPDLVLVRTANGRTDAWTVKDPLSLRYFQLRAEEYEILDCLNGRATLHEILNRLRQRFPGHRMTPANVTQFISTLLKSGLLAGTTLGLGRRVADQVDAQKRTSRWQKLLSLMSFRFRGIDPDSLLRAIEPITRPLTSRAALTIAAAMMLSAAMVVLTRIDQVIARLPDLATIASPANLPWLALTFVLIKILHELGHAVACRRIGGECHEIGIILVAFMPLLYCDVTDSWMNAKRRNRIAVAMAGVIVELTLAAICTFLWLASPPGPENALFLNVMLVCGVNTLLFNGNPLLRYDGYYVLSDLIGIPNLGNESRQVVWSAFDRVVLGLETDSLFRRRGEWWFLFIYGMASIAYRWVVMLGIMWFLHRTLREVGLSALSVVFVGPGFVVTAVMPVLAIFGRLKRLASEEHTTRHRSMIGAGIFLTLTAVGLLVPLPHHIHAPFVLQPPIDDAVFVTVPGHIQKAVAAGTEVAENDELAALVNPSLTSTLEQHDYEVQQLHLRLKHLNAQRSYSPEVAAQIPSTEEALASAEARLTRVRNEAERLQIRSQQAGTIVPPPNLPARMASDGVERWRGNPLEASNRNSWLSQQTLLCYVTDPKRLEAVLFVDEQTIERVASGQDVELTFASDPANPATGEIVSVAAVPIDEVRREITAAGLVPLVPPGSRAPTWFQAKARITAPAAVAYTPGIARIRVGSMSLATRAWRAIQRVFAIEL